MQTIILASAWYFAFLFSLVCHEAAHAFTAMKLGDDTAYEGGQVTLDPLPHIKREPLGTVLVPLISYMAGGWMFGWASAPYDLYWAMQYPKRSALMALAGPATNLFLALAAGILIRLGVQFGIFDSPSYMSFQVITVAFQPGFPSAFAMLLGIMFSLNLLLCIFNLLPFPPLDGSGIVPLFLEEETAQKYMSFVSNSPFMIIGILIAWRIIDVIFHPIHTFFVNVLYLGIASY